MFGKNPVMKIQPDEDVFKVVDVWFTIQGEGPFAGSRAVFVRLHGCNLRCHFCDTEFSKPDDLVYTADALGKHIAELLTKHQTNLVVITGGEPMLWPLHRLMVGVDAHTPGNRRVLSFQIETAGTTGAYLPQMEDTAIGLNANLHIVVSPKTPTVDRAVGNSPLVMAFKYVIGPDTVLEPNTRAPITKNTQNPDGGTVVLAAPPPGVAVYLSPMDSYDPALNTAALKRVGQLVMETPGTLAGVQMHKYLTVD